jgi:hypothetical protein
MIMASFFGDPIRLPLIERLGGPEDVNYSRQVGVKLENDPGRLRLADRLGSGGLNATPVSYVSPEEKEAQFVNDTLSYICTADEYNTWPRHMKRVDKFESAMRLVKEYAPEKFSELLNITDLLGVWMDEATSLYPNAIYDRANYIARGRRCAVLNYKVEKKDNAGATKAINIFTDIMIDRIGRESIKEETFSSQDSYEDPCDTASLQSKERKRKRS